MGQVSSQTLQNLARHLPGRAGDAGAPPAPRLQQGRDPRPRPEIGIYDLAAAVGEYCDLMPRRPATRAILQQVLKDEAAMDPRASSTSCRHPHHLRPPPPPPREPRLPGPGDRPPPRGRHARGPPGTSAYRAWSYPGALHLDFGRALEAWPSFARDRTYVLVCEVGLKSAHLAERMQEEGFQAFHFRGGIKELMALAEREKLVEPSLLAPAVRD